MAGLGKFGCYELGTTIGQIVVLRDIAGGKQAFLIQVSKDVDDIWPISGM